MEIARRLDNGESVCESKSVTLSTEIEQILSDPTITRKGRDKSAIKRAFNALKTRLK